MERIRIRRSDNHISREGFEEGTLSIAQETPVYLVLHEKGHKYWAQLPPNSFSYTPAEYQVYRIEDKSITDREIVFQVEPLVRFPVKLTRADSSSIMRVEQVNGGRQNDT